MFGESLFGTIRFGESPEMAVSPVLLSGVGVETPGNAGAGMQAMRSLHCVGREHSSAFLPLLPSRVLSNRSWSQSRALSRVSVLWRSLVYRGEETENSRPEMRIYRAVASAQGATPLAQFRIGAVAVLASTNGIGTASWGALSFPGLVLWSVQEGEARGAQEIRRGLASDTPASLHVAQATIVIRTVLASTVWSWGHITGALQPTGLLILNIQSTTERSRLHVERRVKSKRIENPLLREVSVWILRPLRDVAHTQSNNRGRLLGRGLAVRTVQGSWVLGRFPLRRTLTAHSEVIERAATGLAIARRLESTGAEWERTVFHPFLLRGLAATDIQREIGETLLGRVRGIGGFDVEGHWSFSRFAVVPDLRNDRVVVIFGEGRRVVIPRQSEL